MQLASTAVREPVIKMSPKFVYLRFYDSKKFTICSVSDVLSFNPKNDEDFENTSFYNVQGSDGLYHPAQIILLRESGEELEKQLAEMKENNVRIRFHSYKQMGADFTSSTSKHETETAQQIKKAEEKARKAAINKNQNDKEILKEKKRALANYSLLPSSIESSPKSHESENNINDLRKKLEERERGNKILREKLEALESSKSTKKARKSLSHSFDQCGERGNKENQEEALEEEPEISSEEDYNVFNRTKEDNLESLPGSSGLQNTSSSSGSQKMQKHNIKRRGNISASESSDVEENVHTIRRFERYATFSQKKGNGEKVKRVHLGDGYHIKKETWQAICLLTDDSKFVKNLATALWHRRVLANRYLKFTTTLKQLINRSPRKPLTPSKKKVLEDCLRDHLRQQGVKGFKLQKRVADMGHYVSHHINTLRSSMEKSSRKATAPSESQANNSE